MADNIVGSLFGVDPSTLQRQQQIADQNQAYRYAQLSPMEQAKYLQATGAAGLARGVGGLLGMEDPELQKASKIKQIASQIDYTNPEGLRTLANAIKDFAPQEAMMAVKRADEMAESRATVEQKTRERAVPTSSLGKLLAERDALPANDPRRAAYDEAIRAEGKGRGTTIIMPGEAQNKILREKRTGKLLDLEDTALAAQDTLQTVNDFRGIVDKAFTGVGSGAKLTAGQLSTALGIPVSGTSETEQLNQLFAGLTTGQAKNLKGSLSDKDLKFLKEAVGTSGLTPATLKNVISRIEREALIDAKTFDLASQYEGDYSKMNLVELKKQAQKDVNTRFDKQKRLEELRAKQSQK